MHSTKVSSLNTLSRLELRLKKSRVYLDLGETYLAERSISQALELALALRDPSLIMEIAPLAAELPLREKIIGGLLHSRRIITYRSVGIAGIYFDDLLDCMNHLPNLPSAVARLEALAQETSGIIDSPAQASHTSRAIANILATALLLLIDLAPKAGGAGDAGEAARWLLRLAETHKNQRWKARAEYALFAILQEERGAEADQWRARAFRSSAQSGQNGLMGLLLPSPISQAP